MADENDNAPLKPKRTRRKQTPISAGGSTPHSWSFRSWPEHVWPHDGKRGQWLCRAYRRQLVAAGAISRIGAQMVIIGRGYTRWLEQHTESVEDYQSNNPLIGRHERRASAASAERV